MKFETETKDFTRTPPSGFAAHLPFQGRHELGTDCAVSGVFVARKIPLETFHRNVSKVAVLQAGHRAERSCSLRPRKAVAFLTHLLRAPKSTGAGNFAVCGQRLRGHVPSKNTSPTALSWISLFEHTDAVRFCPCTMIFVPAPVISQHVRSALEKLPLFAPFSVCQKHGAESFAVCGRRLRGHVPSKNTSPTALSWISLMGQQF